MYVSNNRFDNNISALDTDKKKPAQTETKDETIVKRDITINIKEEIKLTGNQSQTGNIPAVSPFMLVPQMPSDPTRVNSAFVAIDNIVNSSDKINLVTHFSDFSRAVGNMNSEQLLQVADRLSTLMQKTDGNDEILGELQKMVFDKLKNVSNGISIFPTGIPSQPEIPPTENIIPPEPVFEPIPQIELKPVSEEELNWAMEIQEKLRSGEKISPEEENKYNDIQMRYSETQPK